MVDCKIYRLKNNKREILHQRLITDKNPFAKRFCQLE